MNTIKQRLDFTLLLILVLFTSCVKDDEGFRVERNSDNSDIFGVVTNIDEEPISGALVTYRSNTVTTDEDGVYRFNDVEVGPQHNAIKIEKDGYFESARTFRTAEPSVLYQSTILQEKRFFYSFISFIDHFVENERVRIDFPANSVVYEDTGETYTGLVLVAMASIDPTLDQFSERMPGDLSAMEDNNTISTLQSFGMVYVEMQSETGRKLQIAENQNVEMTYTVSDVFLSQAPETIDMWSFDFDDAIWVKEGQATLDGNKYTGAVSHFSCWNYDVSAPSVVVSGQIITDQGDLSYFRVSLLNADNKGGRGSTDDQGKFSGRVEAGVELDLTVTAYGVCDDIIYEERVGPFDSDTDIGEIMIEILNQEILTITGTALDCDQNRVATGRTYIQRRVFPFINGEIDIFYTACDPAVADIKIVDELSLQQVIIPNIQIPGVEDLEEIMVCSGEAINLTVDNLIDEPLVYFELVETGAGYVEITDETGVMIIGTSRFDTDTIGVRTTSYIRFKLGDGEIVDIETGNYNLTFAEFSYGDDLNFRNNENATDIGSATIQSVIENDSGQTEIGGTYSANVEERNTGEQRVITGSFNIIAFR